MWMSSPLSCCVWIKTETDIENEQSGRSLMFKCNILQGFVFVWGGGHTGQVGATTTCSQNKHVGEFLYFKLPKLPVQVKSRAIKDVTKYVLNTDVQFTN